jgi:chain length determinant protein tyrosine kinase EpsG
MNGQILTMPRVASDPQHEPQPTLDDVGARPLGALLIDAGRLSPDDAQRILEHQKRTGLPYGEAGIALGLVTEEDVRFGLSMQFGHAWMPSWEPGSGLVAASQPDSPAVEHLRGLRSQLMLRWLENDTERGALAVVSTGSGEGRTYIAANLAVLFSQLGKRTLLIDADLRRPRIHQIFGLSGRSGLSNMLAGRAGNEAVTQIRSIPGLSVLSAGSLPPNPQELLARAGFGRLLNSFRSTYEVILLDTPAARVCADAGTVAARAGAALVVACRDRSSVPQISRLTDDLRQFGVNVVGSVLTGARG